MCIRDRSFVFPMADDARAAALVASTIDLAHSLGLRIVAEGVETAVAYTELARLGCDQAQGYFMSRPVPAAELDHWLSTRRAAKTLSDIPQLRSPVPIEVVPGEDGSVSYTHLRAHETVLDLVCRLLLE